MGNNKYEETDEKYISYIFILHVWTYIYVFEFMKFV